MLFTYSSHTVLFKPLPLLLSPSISSISQEVNIEGNKLWSSANLEAGRKMREREGEKWKDSKTCRLTVRKKEVKERLVAKCFRATIRRILRKLFQVSESGMRIRNASVRLKVKFAKVNHRRKERRRDQNTRKQKEKKTKHGKGRTTVSASAC